MYWWSQWCAHNEDERELARRCECAGWSEWFAHIDGVHADMIIMRFVHIDGVHTDMNIMRFAHIDGVHTDMIIMRFAHIDGVQTDMIMMRFINRACPSDFGMVLYNYRMMYTQ